MLTVPSSNFQVRKAHQIQAEGGAKHRYTDRDFDIIEEILGVAERELSQAATSGDVAAPRLSPTRVMLALNNAYEVSLTAVHACVRDITQTALCSAAGVAKAQRIVHQRHALLSIPPQPRVSALPAPA
jgi:hypothetical protein